ncbi:MAG: VWA domain-containing protein [Limnohabitans sp.]|nr:VWA domain-containing protein [Limnohabitans sp.]
MRQARIGLRHLFKQLHEDDSFAYTRFGSSIDRVTPKMSPAYNERIQSLLSTLERTEADLGGTELGKAMTDVFNMNALDRKNPDAPQSADVLLITDGDVWDIENILASARISGHRVYTIGVGSAPAESLLRELAKDSGGACEFVTPQEDMRGAVDRMLHRMRSAQEVRFAIKWNATEEKHKEHEWASTLPPHLISGETVHLFARLPAKTDKPPVLICKTLIKNEEHEACSAKPTSITWDTEGIVARLCAAAQIAELTESKADTKLARSLAIQYQLVTQHTNLFLLHERAEENKAECLPKLQQVAQMQAAGWAGHGTAFNRKGSEILMCMALPMHDSISSNSYGRLNTPSVWRTNRTQAASGVDGMASQSMNDIEIPAFLRKQSDSIDERAESSSISYREMHSIDPSEVSMTGQLIDKVMDWVTPFSHKPPVQSAPTPPKAAPTPPPEASLKDIAQALNSASLQATSFRIALQHTLKLNVPQNYAQVIIDLTKITKDSATSWALLFEWLLGENGNHALLDKHAQRLLRSQLKLATVEMHEKAKGLFERALVGGITLGNA